MGRILVNPRDIQGRKLHLKGASAHHVVHVMRKKPGDLIEATDGEGRNYEVRLEKTAKNNLEGILLKAESAPAHAAGPRLYQAIPKSQRMDWVIEKAVELGAGSIHPLWTKHSVVIPKSKDFNAKLERWRRIAGEALAQSEGSVLCPVHAPCSLEEALSEIKTDDLNLACWESETKTTLKEVLRREEISIKAGRALNLFIGPEGGFAEEEIRMFRARGIPTVTLGRKVLRSDTAPLMVLSAILYESFL
jgi:16S rRNA (uracil1498-N3)-methyltransferase